MVQPQQCLSSNKKEVFPILFCQSLHKGLYFPRNIYAIFGPLSRTLFNSQQNVSNNVSLQRNKLNNNNILQLNLSLPFIHLSFLTLSSSSSLSLSLSGWFAQVQARRRRRRSGSKMWIWLNAILGWKHLLLTHVALY